MLRTGVSVLAAGAVMLGGLLAGAPVHADDLNDQKKAVERQIAQTEKDLNESSHELSAAVAALQRAQADLAAAEKKLEQTRRDLAKAKARDVQMAERLKTAQANLVRAKRSVADGEAKLAEQKRAVGTVVSTEVQQQTNLLGLALLARHVSTRDLSNRVQYSTTLFNATQAGVDQLRTVQAQLERDKANQASIERQVSVDRAEAAANLITTTQLEQQAEQEEQRVAGLVAANAAAKKSAEHEVAADKARYRQLNAERDAVQKRIEKRLAEQKRKAEAERKRKEEQDRKRREAAKRQSAKSSGGSGSSTSSRPSRSRRAAPAAHHGFVYPVNAPITSSYGMRLHPILGYWKLHDGTDFGAGCGTAIRAPYSGRVAERYYNGGYGNRLIIDHGRVDGAYITTAMNHATRYTVGVGQWVSKGEVVGYVGSTGYSTGCHLHFMVWKNGSLLNPMSWY